MSLEYWGFTHPPFRRELPVRDFFLSPSFVELTARLHLMVEGRLFGVVTGDIGSGKSSAVRDVVQQWDPTKNRSFMWPNPRSPRLTSLVRFWTARASRRRFIDRKPGVNLSP